ncbi:hypothetical protein V8E54_003734 [Elaphomyces granulatus]
MEVPMDVLGTPLKYRVEREYLGPDSKHVVAHGDYVVVCAWIQNHTTALAYSENNSSIGKIPASCLDLQDSRPAVIDGVYLALANQNVSSESFWDIGWVPFLLIASDEDESAPLDGCRYIFTTLSSSQKTLEVLHGVGHFH